MSININSYSTFVISYPTYAKNETTLPRKYFIDTCGKTVTTSYSSQQC